jgi:hypothetical protein
MREDKEFVVLETDLLVDLLTNVNGQFFCLIVQSITSLTLCLLQRYASLGSTIGTVRSSFCIKRDEV